MTTSVQIVHWVSVMFTTETTTMPVTTVLHRLLLDMTSSRDPIVPSVGDTAFQSGVAVPDFRNLGTTYVGFFDNGGGVQGDPGNGREAYAYLRGRWPNEQRFTFGGTGLDFSNIPVNFMFPGDPETGHWLDRRKPSC